VYFSGGGKLFDLKAKLKQLNMKALGKISATPRSTMSRPDLSLVANNLIIRKIDSESILNSKEAPLILDRLRSLDLLQDQDVPYDLACLGFA
jgi:hypothetical protein